MGADSHKLIKEPCPHCGSWDLHVVELVVLPAGDEPRAYVSDYFVGCGYCGALGPPAASTIDAIINWNKRS